MGRPQQAEEAKAHQGHLEAAGILEGVRAEAGTLRPVEELQEAMVARAAVARASRLAAQVGGLMGTHPGVHRGAHQVVRPEGIQAGLRMGLAGVVRMGQEVQAETPAGLVVVALAEADQATQEAVVQETQVVDGQREALVETGAPRILKWMGSSQLSRHCAEGKIGSSGRTARKKGGNVTNVSKSSASALKSRRSKESYC